MTEQDNLMNRATEAQIELDRAKAEFWRKLAGDLKWLVVFTVMFVTAATNYLLQLGLELMR